MGKPSRDKGARGELEILDLLPGAVKTSGMYKTGPDGMWRGRYYEVKRRAAKGFAMLYRWLDDDSSLLFMRADRQRWLVCMDLDTLQDLLDEAQQTGTE